MYFIYDDYYLKHENGISHPENPDRLKYIKTAADSLADNLIPVIPLDQVTHWIESWQHVARNRLTQFGKTGIQRLSVSLLLALHVVIRVKLQG